MPKMLCNCGKVLSFSPIPNPIEYLFISDVDFDFYDGMADTDALYERFQRFAKCPDCGRLWVFWNGFSEMPTSYLPEA
ncbi:hypothetical protein [Deinococcus roseus]|uniref:CpXC domain-containing protein n=1 Tax=Deinococcus roseus TaxID=392414 RepID=A0ABQ2CYL1_9DEIO|nr:hypothetical protein [Deinococcus roseus]GGJ28928.1 hypothetical protein GCM10008938_13770 [Deinococcus roseus]